ncbi:hypothetical protein TNCT_167131 [Trichonephila clavata]|uniref:Uncharacterized protein n=1 Tax=Trichonephila clavata TaxID=2740835 RepID=A0A8X6JMF9_TRICU|nr:hypothetical protein TNCT_167131 [Trichonephila clavata]
MLEGSYANRYTDRASEEANTRSISNKMQRVKIEKIFGRTVLCPSIFSMGLGQHTRAKAELASAGSQPDGPRRQHTKGKSGSCVEPGVEPGQQLEGSYANRYTTDAGRKHAFYSNKMQRVKMKMNFGRTVYCALAFSRWASEAAYKEAKEAVEPSRTGSTAWKAAM